MQYKLAEPSFKEPIVSFPNGQLGIAVLGYPNNDCLYLLGDGRIIRLAGPENFK